MQENTGNPKQTSTSDKLKNSILIITKILIFYILLSLLFIYILFTNLGVGDFFRVAPLALGSTIIAISIPWLSIFINHSLRLRRIRLIHVLQLSISITGSRKGKFAKPRTQDETRPSSLEFVSAKYMIDLPSDIIERSKSLEDRIFSSDPSNFPNKQEDTNSEGIDTTSEPEVNPASAPEAKPANISEAKPANASEAKPVDLKPDPKKTQSLQYEIAELFNLIQNVKCFDVRDNKIILYSSIPYSVFTSVLIFLSLYYTIYSINSPSLAFYDNIIQLLIKRERILNTNYLQNSLIICFISSYIHSMNQIKQAIIAFDLTSVDYFQALKHALISLLSLFVIFFSFDVFLGLFGSSLAGGKSVSKESTLYLIAFTIGQIPESGFLLIITAIGRLPAFSRGLRSFKRKDDRFTEVTSSIPIDVIDGIDLKSRLRLEDAGIDEVQNLATYNPILLHIESRFGLFQSIDWIAQAQLCTVVGLERFLMLRQFNIRTIFDLERAVLSLKSTKEIKNIVANILFIPTSSGIALQSISGFKMPILNKASDSNVSRTGDATYADFSNYIGGQISKKETVLFRRDSKCKLTVNTNDTDLKIRYKSEFIDKINYLFSYNDNINDTTGSQDAKFDVYSYNDEFTSLQHLVLIILDDLHVVRLRQVWEWIDRSIGTDARSLDDTIASIFGA